MPSNKAQISFIIFLMKERNAILMLLLVSFIWGFSFVAQTISTESVGAFTFTGLRMILAFFALLPFALKKIKEHSDDKEYMISLIRGGILMGLFLASASLPQQAALSAVDAGKAAFMTSLYVIIVPFLSRIAGKKIEKRIWLCAAIALTGMYMLCLSDGMALSREDIYLLLSAFLFSCHILIIEKETRDKDGIELSLIQFLTAGVISIIGMFIFERPEISQIKKAALPLAYSGFLSCGVAFTLQSVAQKYVKSSKATLSLSLESVWAALGGAVILKQTLSQSEITGCALVFLALLLAPSGAARDEIS